jgi:5'-deoxynucleotidase YfbR-like HD superfamily hydrolase/nucleoside phosphorylase
MDQIENSLKTSSCDFLLIIALKEEFEYFIRAFNLEYETGKTTEGIIYYRFQLPASQERYAEGAVGFIGDMGIEQANLFTYQLISELQPGLVANIGISGIVDDQLKLGDVAIATEADDYLHRGKIQQRSPNGPLTFDALRLGGKSYSTTVALCDVLDNLEFTDPDAWKVWIKQSANEITSSLNDSNIRLLKKEGLIADTTKAYIGPVAVGPWVGAAKKFKEFLTTHNRNYIAMDMESAGVLQVANQHSYAPKTVVLRGMSDPADERKQLLDIMDKGALRRWAMVNALRLFALLIKKVDLDFYSRRELEITAPLTSERSLEQLTDKIHKIILQEFLDAPYNNASYVRNHPYETYSNLFNTITKLQIIDTNSNLFELLANIVLASKGLTTFWVEGFPGTGKTSFLSILYWYFLDIRTSDKNNPLPIFINLHRYNELTPQSGVSLPLEEQALTAIQNHLKPLRNIIENTPEQSLLIIIDGYDAFARFKEQISVFLFDLLKDCQHWRIIGSRDGSGSLNPDDDETEIYSPISLHSIKTEDGTFQKFIQAFLSVAAPNNPTIAASLEQIIKKSKLKNIDIFTLSLIFEYYKNPRTTNPDDLSGLLENYCEKFFRHRLNTTGSKSGMLERAASIAFSYEVRRTKKMPENDEDKPLWELIHRHSRIRDYLVARHMIMELVKNAQGNAKKIANSLRYVFTHRVNRFSKELLNKDQQIQLQVIEAVDNVLKRDKTHPYAKAQACYLAGRVEDWQAKNNARDVLNRYREQLKKRPLQQESEKDSKVNLLIMRTLYISLAYLGDKSAQQEYIEKLLSDSEMDSFNRGFHLEYYEDQEYTPSEALISEDHLGPCPKTFEQLFINLTKEEDPIFEIELYTLCSLAQHRHAVGSLAQPDREHLISTIDEMLNRHKIKSTILRNYVLMIRKHLSHERFRIGRIFEDYYKIKRVKRSGWVDRNILDAESVADHSYGAYLLALFLLPDAWGADYDKQKIMNMLLVHDLAEAITGDVLPKDSNEQSKQREAEVYEEIAMLGTYNGLARMREVAELWKEFEAQASLNAQVAKDIDKLENLIQLWVYKGENLEIKDFDKWSQGLINAVKTEPGMQVLEKMLSSYEDKAENN